MNRDFGDAAGIQAVMIVLFTIGVLVDALVFGTLERKVRRRYGLIGTNPCRDLTGRHTLCASPAPPRS